MKNIKSFIDFCKIGVVKESGFTDAGWNEFNTLLDKADREVDAAAASGSRTGSPGPEGNGGVDATAGGGDEKFTIEEIRAYVLCQDSMGDIAYNLSVESIRVAIEQRKEEEEIKDEQLHQFTQEHFE